MIRRLLALITTGVLVSCSTYQSKVFESRNLLKQGHISEALEKLKALAEKPGDDQLVYLLDYGTALNIAGNYKESIAVFLQADKLAEIQDYHSITNVTMATLGSEEMIQYKGESYEKILINAYLALNYLMLGQEDEALVEARRVTEKINKFRQEGRQDYEQNPFAHYLSGLIWESERKFDDAYISFEDSYKLDGSNPFLPADLVRSAKRARREDAYKKWKEEFSNLEESPTWYDKNMGELVVIFLQGWGPEKHFSNVDRRFPKLHPVFSATTSARVKVENVGEFPTQTVYNIEAVAIKTLDDDYSWMAARKIGAFAAKEVVADQIRQKNETLGFFAWIFMHASDRADLRQWSTLPRTIQMARVQLRPGTYKVSVQGLDGSGSATADQFDPRDVVIASGRKTFLSVRSLR